MKKFAVLLTVSISLLLGCTFANPEPAADVTVPTPIGQAASADDPPSPASPTEATTAVSTQAPPTTATASPTDSPPTSTIAPTAPPPVPEASFRVIHVTNDDTLNVRSGPGVDNPVVGELSPNAENVQITGAGVEVAGSTWVPITSGTITGWVNGRFLTTPANTFCQDSAPAAMLENLKLAVINQDDHLLATLIHPERGLRIRRYWWSDEFYFSQLDATTLFTSTESYEWGIEPGSGFAIEGSFTEEIVPLLEADLVNAAEQGCNELLEGGSANLVIIPAEYEGIDFYSSYRPGQEQFGFLDWGSWAIGIEQVDGLYYLSYLVHYEWEI